MLRALDKFLVKGLGSIQEHVARDLAGFLRANGLGKAAARAREIREDKPDRRYRAFVELRIALEEAVVKLFRPGHLGAPLPAGATLVVVGRTALGAPDELIEAAGRFEGTPEALAYLQAVPDLGGLTGEQVEVLMANDDLRRPAARALGQAPPEQVREWVRHLAGAANGLARRGAYLLAEALDPGEAARETLPSWSREEDQDDAFESFHPRRLDMREGLLAGLDPDRELPLAARRFALRLVARSAKEGEADRWEPLAGDDPELVALVKLARFKSGEVLGDRLRAWASSAEEPELRALATLQCWMEGDVDPRAHQTELQRNRANLHLLLAPLRNTARLEIFLKQWQASLELSRPQAERARAAEELLASGDRRLASRLLHTLADPSPAIRERLQPYLAAAMGLYPVRLLVDLAPLETTPPEQFSSDVVRAYERWLLPIVPRIPDARLAPWIGHLLGRGATEVCPEAVRAMGGALTGELAVLLSHPEPAVQTLARQSLEALRHTPRAARILEDHEAGKDPMEAALERLLLPELAAEGKRALEALDRATTVPRLVEVARSRKLAREAVLEVLSEWRAEAALPVLVKLLGSPLPDMVRGKPGNRETRWVEKSTGRHLLAYGAGARPALEAALESANWTVRHHAAHLLGELALEASSVPLARALEAEAEEESRAALVAALGRTGGEEAVVALEPLVRSSLVADQIRAVRALHGVRTASARGLLEEVMATAKDLGLKRELRRVLEAWDAGPA